MTKLKLMLGAMAALFLMAGAVHADPYASAAYQFQDGKKGQSDANGYRFIVGNKFNQNWSAEVAGETMRSNTSKTVGTLIEGAVIPSIAVNKSVSAYVRGAVGNNYTSGANGFSYYSVEPGVIVKVADATGVKLGYRYRDAFTDSNGFQTRTWRLGVEQGLTKQTSGFVGYDRSRGDSNYDAVLVGVNVRF